MGKEVDGVENYEEGTIFAGGEEPTEKKKRGRKPGGTNTSKKISKVTADECKTKIDLVMAFLCGILGKEYTLSADDYTAEGTGLARFSEKMPIVAYVITILDPVMVLFSLFKKFQQQRRKEKPEEPKPAENVIPFSPGEQSNANL